MQLEKSLVSPCSKNPDPGRVFPGVAIRLVPRPKTPNTFEHSAFRGLGFGALVLQGLKGSGCVCVAVSLSLSLGALLCSCTYVWAFHDIYE